MFHSAEHSRLLCIVTLEDFKNRKEEFLENNEACAFLSIPFEAYRFKGIQEIKKLFSKCFR